MSDFNIDELTALFFEELDEQLNLVDECILRLEKNDDVEGSIQVIFRAAHTIKGSSAAMGFEAMKEITHEMEHILDLVRKHIEPVTPTLIDLLFRTMDNLKLLQGLYARGAVVLPDLSEIIRELRAYVHVSTTMESDRGQSHRQEMIIRVSLDPDCAMMAVRAYVIANKLSELGLLQRTEPKLPSEENLMESFDARDIDYYFATDVSTAELEAILLSMMDVMSVSFEDQSVCEDEFTPRPSVSKLQEIPAGTERFRSSTIRVNLERLEELMNLVGELVIDQARIQLTRRKLQLRYGADEDVKELETISDHISRTVATLQDQVMKVRMVPVEQLFGRFPRLVRDLAQQLGKRIELSVEGNETELDRTLIEEISDPLIHMIRNAVDHGIESPTHRLEMHKPEIGRLMIKAMHEDNQVVIVIEDDGAGIDAEKMRQTGVRKGLFDAVTAEQMTDYEAIRLIFYPGFSTAATISDISGRGVGMDIVSKHIQELSGTIEIDTLLHMGTKFMIKLPLTLAIITGLLLRIGHHTLVMPMNHVTEIIRVHQGRIEKVQGTDVIQNRGQIIPVLWLHDQFQVARPANSKLYYHLVIIGIAEKRVALVVDELLGNQEVVIKTLGSYVGKMEWFSGSTILGDGNVALIMNASSLFKQQA